MSRREITARRRSLVPLLVPLMAAMATLAGGRTGAQGPRAVRPLPGVHCMALKHIPPWTPGQVPDPGAAAPVRRAPSDAAPVIDTAAAIVLVQDAGQVGRYVRVLLPDGAFGWMRAADLRPWRNPWAPGIRCLPSVMSDGKPGFAFEP